MISGLDLNSTIDFTLSNDKENPTVWKLAKLPSTLFAKITTESMKASDELQGSFYLCRVGIKGWDNFNVAFKNEEVELYGHKVKAVPVEVIQQIPLEAIVEITNRLMEINQVNVDQRKN